MGYIGVILALLIALWLWTSGTKDHPSPIEQVAQTQQQVSVSSQVVNDFNAIQKAEQAERSELLKK